MRTIQMAAKMDTLADLDDYGTKVFTRAEADAAAAADDILKLLPVIDAGVKLDVVPALSGDALKDRVRSLAGEISGARAKLIALHLECWELLKATGHQTRSGGPR